MTSQNTIPVKPLSNSPPPLAKAKVEEATPRTKTSNIELGKVLRTDSPAIAIGNLDSAIKLKTNQFQTDQIRNTALWELVHHHLTRARYLGRTDSFKQAESIAAAAYKKDMRAETLELVADVDIAMHRFDRSAANRISALRA